MSRVFSAVATAVFSFIFVLAPVIGAAQSQQAHSERVELANKDTVGIVSGGIGGTYIRVTADLQAELDQVDNLRILPILGKGSVKNIEDLLYLRGIDVAIVQSDVLTFLSRQNVHEDLPERINYITKLYNEEFHLITRDDISDIKQLRGKKVNFGGRGSGTAMTAETVFDALGVPVIPLHHGYQDALQMVRNGEIAAMVYVAGKPASIFKQVKPEAGLRILPVPFTPKLQESYLPATVTSKDYEGLVPPGDTVDTIAVGAVMAVFNWKKNTGRYYRVKQFIESFFSRFEEFQKPPRHKKWKEVNLAAELPGWRRYPVAEEWLQSNKLKVALITPAAGSKREMFAAFQAYLDTTGRAASLSPSEQKKLFNQFLEWNREAASSN
jgi:TRAP transporter TAXI family solute receptor